MVYASFPSFLGGLGLEDGYVKNYWLLAVAVHVMHADASEDTCAYWVLVQIFVLFHEPLLSKGWRRASWGSHISGSTAAWEAWMGVLILKLGGMKY